MHNSIERFGLWTFLSYKTKLNVLCCCKKSIISAQQQTLEFGNTAILMRFYCIIWRYHYPNGSDEHWFDIDSVQALQIATVIVMTV